jgi:hypothetical protein
LNDRKLLQILETRSRQQGFSPLEILVLMKLGFYQMKFITSLAAEYLEEERRIPEWEWLSRLHVLYYRLYISSLKLVDLARAVENKGRWAERFEPVLQEMRITLESAIDHLKKYPAQ